MPCRLAPPSSSRPFMDRALSVVSSICRCLRSSGRRAGSPLSHEDTINLGNLVISGQRPDYRKREILLDRADTRATSYSLLARCSFTGPSIAFRFYRSTRASPSSFSVLASYGRRAFNLRATVALPRLIHQTPFTAKDESAMPRLLHLPFLRSGICGRIAVRLTG